MVHVNLTITGETDEVIHIIRSLAPPQPALVVPPVVEPTPASVPAPDPTPEPEPQPTLLPAVSAPADYVPTADSEAAAETTADWTPDKAATLMSGVSGDAALVLLYLARRSPAEAMPEQIRADLQFEPRQLTNALISVGNRASRNGLPTPAVIKKGGILRLPIGLAQSLNAGETEAETDSAGTPQSQRNAEWFDFSR